MSKKIKNLTSLEPAEDVNFVKVDISGESSDNNEIYRDQLQDRHPNLESCKARNKISIRKRGPVVSSKTLHEQSQYVNSCKIKRMEEVIVKTEPAYESKEDGEQASCNVVEPVKDIKREVSESNEDHSEISNFDIIAKSKRFKNDQDSNITSYVSAKQEPTISAGLTSVFGTLPVKSELIIEDDEEHAETNETAPANR